MKQESVLKVSHLYTTTMIQIRTPLRIHLLKTTSMGLPSDHKHWTFCCRYGSKRRELQRKCEALKEQPATYGSALLSLHDLDRDLAYENYKGIYFKWSRSFLHTISVQVLQNPFLSSLSVFRLDILICLVHSCLYVLKSGRQELVVPLSSIGTKEMFSYISQWKRKPYRFCFCFFFWSELRGSVTASAKSRRSVASGKTSVASCARRQGSTRRLRPVTVPSPTRLMYRPRAYHHHGTENSRPPGFSRTAPRSRSMHETHQRLMELTLRPTSHKRLTSAET